MNAAFAMVLAFPLETAIAMAINSTPLTFVAAIVTPTQTTMAYVMMQTTVWAHRTPLASAMGTALPMQTATAFVMTWMTVLENWTPSAFAMVIAQLTLTKTAFATPTKWQAAKTRLHAITTLRPPTMTGLVFLLGMPATTATLRLSETSTPIAPCPTLAVRALAQL